MVLRLFTPTKWWFCLDPPLHDWSGIFCELKTERGSPQWSWCWPDYLPNAELPLKLKCQILLRFGDIQPGRWYSMALRTRANIQTEALSVDQLQTLLVNCQVFGSIRCSIAPAATIQSLAVDLVPLFTSGYHMMYGCSFLPRRIMADATTAPAVPRSLLAIKFHYTWRPVQVMSLRGQYTCCPITHFFFSCNFQTFSSLPFPCRCVFPWLGISFSS